MAASPAAKDLAEFAAASGSAASPPQSHLDQIGKAPTPPVMDPGFANTQADLRAKSAVTQRYDPATGKVLDQYKPSMGSRIGRAFLDAGRGFLYGGLGGAIAAPLEGAFGNRNSPGYYGAGAVSSQYGRDEQARQQAVAADTAKIGSYDNQYKQAQTQFKDQNDVYKDVQGTAYKQDITDLKQQHEEEIGKRDKENADIKQQLADAKDPQAKLEAETNARSAIAKKMNLNANDTKLYVANGKLPDDQTIARKLQIEEERLGLERSKEARASAADGGQWYTTPRELADFKNRTAALDREASSIEQRRTLYTEGGTADKESQDAQKRLGDRLTAIGQEKDSIKQQIIQNRPSNRGKQQAAQPAGAASPQGMTPIPDKSIKSKGGTTYSVGDKIPGKGTIKSFSKDKDGNPHANFQ
jgi:hypothetical protein